MSNSTDFDFGNDSVATAYDNVLVPSIFEPWARALIHENDSWDGLTVLDLASGTGAVTKEIAQRVLPDGHVYALDINPHMIAIAKEQCATWSPYISFCEGSAEHIHCPDHSVDVVVCQQGFQFFPEKALAAKEIYRVLKPGGKVIVSTWRSVKECDVFGIICEALEDMAEHETAQMMRMPFDFLNQDELQSFFEGAGFSQVNTRKEARPLTNPDTENLASKIAFGTPIAPKLSALYPEKLKQFNALTREKSLRLLSDDKNQLGQMVANILVAIK